MGLGPSEKGPDYAFGVASISVIGTGYVGLSSGACLALLGHSVVCADIDERKVAMLSEGRVPIVEAGLEEAVAEGLSNGKLSFTVDVEAAVAGSDIVFLCLPTPRNDDGSADLSYVLGVAGAVRDALRPNAVVVNKSTVPVGTARVVKDVIGRDDVSVVSNPEFLRQGTAVHDFLHPSRVVVGSDDPVALEKVADLYSAIDAPLLRMNAASAEALKYAANSFLATKLTFVNAIADICEVVGADIFDVVEGLGMDPRIGQDFLKPGPGWGGSCFPKDTRALVQIAADHGYDFALLRGVIETNDQQYARIAEKVVEMCGGSVEGRTVAVWGLTFKANTDDLRDSPSIAILTMLHDRGAIIRGYDPTARRPYESYPWITVCASPLEACDGADVLAVLTEWAEFSLISPSDVASRLVEKRVVDGRNVLDRENWLSEGFKYLGVGR